MSRIILLASFFTSFMPLWISILFIEFKSIYESEENICTEISMIIVIILINLISLIAILVWIKSAEYRATEEMVLEEVEEEKSISAEYLLSYILPLFAFDFTRWDSVVLFAVFFVTLMYISVRHNYMSINIIFELMNYSLYSCVLRNEDGNSKSRKMIISKVNLLLHRGQIVQVNNINNAYSLIGNNSIENDLIL